MIRQHTLLTYLLIALILIVAHTSLLAQNKKSQKKNKSEFADIQITPPLDTLVAELAPLDSLNIDSAAKTTTKKKPKYNWWQSLIKGNIDRTFEQKFDVTFMVAPSYSQEASIGIGGMATGMYRVDQKDSAMLPSTITFSANITFRLFYGFWVDGNHYFQDHKSRLKYEVFFNNKYLDFWGITIEDCINNPSTKYQRQATKVKAEYIYDIVGAFKFGIEGQFNYSRIAKINNPEYLYGQKLSYIATGIGFSLQYDSRDIISNPKKGIYILLRETVFPQFMGNCGKTLLRTTFTLGVFQKMWKGSTFCYDLFAEFNSKNSPWSMREELGGMYRMRGYYTGRYTDINMISTQIEVRQHIYWRIGCVFWGGAGTVFSSIKEFKGTNILYNFGLGLRFEVKKNTNIRFDYGFGKHTHAFVLSISEAF